MALKTSQPAFIIACITFIFSTGSFVHFTGDVPDDPGCYRDVRICGTVLLHKKLQLVQWLLKEPDAIDLTKMPHPLCTLTLSHVRHGKEVKSFLKSFVGVLA